MVKLVSDDPGAASDNMVLEVDRVEDARTIRQRLRIPAAQWRTFAATVSAGAAPDTVVNAYLAWQGFGTGWRLRMPMRCPLRRWTTLAPGRWRPALPGCPRSIATGKASAEIGA